MKTSEQASLFGYSMADIRACGRLRDPLRTESLSQPHPPTSPTGKDAIAQAIPPLIPELEEVCKIPLHTL